MQAMNEGAHLDFSISACRNSCISFFVLILSVWLVLPSLWGFVLFFIWHTMKDGHE